MGMRTDVLCRDSHYTSLQGYHTDYRDYEVKVLAGTGKQPLETLQPGKEISPLKILIINFSKILPQTIESSTYFEIHELIKGYNRPGKCGSIRPHSLEEQNQ